MADIALGQHPLLRKKFIDRRINGLVENQFVADQLFTKINVDALAIEYAVEDTDVQENRKEKLDPVGEIGERSGYPRVGISEAQKTQMIRKYGLEAVITYEMQKFGQGANGAIERRLRKLATNVRGMVDEMAYNVATNSYTIGNGIQGLDKGGVDPWTDPTNGAENMIADLVNARTAGRKYGYSLDTIVMNPEQEAQFLKNKNIRDAFRQNDTDVALLRGYIGDFLGFSFIVDEKFKENNLLIVQKKQIGDIADAESLNTQVYNEEANEHTVVRAKRFTTAYLTDPKAVYLLKNFNA
ncbi:major capsid protein [Bacillus phage 056SW001B]|uniref:Major capsid protein n=2 Tax=Gettysburgvirus TaxID=3425034 RepID=A0A5J6T5Z8_9CAUD|nr:major capsid protein [Bacillus phage 019DV002]QFG05245.1 major capsid protein [Bacillus phage 019DV004]QFR56483.1 major capsid protein [Bacillus phage 056SW001B]